MAYGQEQYHLYRVYEMRDSEAKLRISRDLRDFALEILDVFERLPHGVMPDSISVEPSMLEFDSERQILMNKGADSS